MDDQELADKLFGVPDKDNKLIKLLGAYEDDQRRNKIRLEFLLNNLSHSKKDEYLNKFNSFFDNVLEGKQPISDEDLIKFLDGIPPVRDRNPVNIAKKQMEEYKKETDWQLFIIHEARPEYAELCLERRKELECAYREVKNRWREMQDKVMTFNSLAKIERLKKESQQEVKAPEQEQALDIVEVIQKIPDEILDELVTKGWLLEDKKTIAKNTSLQKMGDFFYEKGFPITSETAEAYFISGKTKKAYSITSWNDVIRPVKKQ